ncbi:MAG: heme ABC exporter ATP-binding protein CcmA [Beijerinckiaceae bacterium]|nr:heme ABC exporter ATP-binding protein CcmA [Beijerinckiaceae bacterium]
MRLSASSLTIERGGRAIISNVSFALGAGACLTVTGPNGAGKSTLLRALAGLLPIAAGTVSLSPASSEALSERVHYVGHSDALKGVLTAVENLEFLAAILGAGNRGAPPAAALARFGLSHAADLPVAYLSAGQKRRAALARLLAVNRPVWLLDEPLNALDSASQTLLGQVMAAHLAQGGLIIAATHAKLGLASQELRLGTAS